MLAHQPQQLRVDGRPDGVARVLGVGGLVQVDLRWRELGHRLDRHVDAQVERLTDAGVDDDALALRTDEETADFFQRPLGGREADALHVSPGRLSQPLQRRGPDAMPRLSAPPRGSHRRSPTPCRRRRSRACEVSIRYSDSGVVMRMSGGMAQHVAGARAAACRRCARAPARRPRCRAAAPQILLYVVAERLERRDVHQTRSAALGVGRRRLGDEAIECPQEGGKGLAGPGGRRDEHVLAARRWPATPAPAPA